MPASKYVITKKDSDGGYRFMVTLFSPNGRQILVSEMYATKAGAENCAGSMRRNGVEERRFERRESKRKEPYFVLKAGNGAVIGRSTLYESAQAMENGIRSVMKNSATERVLDET